MTSRRDFNPFLSTCAAGKSLNLPMDQVFNIGIIRSSDKWLTQQQALGMMYTLFGQLSILLFPMQGRWTDISEISELPTGFTL